MVLVPFDAAEVALGAALRIELGHAGGRVAPRLHLEMEVDLLAHLSVLMSPAEQRGDRRTDLVIPGHARILRLQGRRSATRGSPPQTCGSTLPSRHPAACGPRR